jgi:hypothetical protein
MNNTMGTAHMYATVTRNLGKLGFRKSLGLDLLMGMLHDSNQQICLTSSDEK